MANFGRRSSAENVSEGIDLRGKNALVTGANTGLGRETARVLAMRGARVTMACRNVQKAEAAKAWILAHSKGQVEAVDIDILPLDLASLDSVREAAARYLASGKPLHLLINNAGIMISHERRTADGFEAHLGINHLGHFLFTGLLLDALKAADGSRVVCVSSAAMGMATLNHELADLNWETRKFSGMRSYGDSKLMNYMFSRELTRRFSAQGIVSNAVHPGVIATELARDQSLPFMALGIFALPFMKRVPQGAATSVYVATAAEYANKGGLYFSNCQEKKSDNKLALDDDLAARVWKKSAELTGLSPL
jgi:retinol dehydrogenase-12